MGVVRGVGYATAAGVFGSLGAVFGKLTFGGSDGLVGWASGWAGEWVGRAAAAAAVRVATFAMIFVPNAGMWGCYVASLGSLSSVHASMVSAMANIMASAVWGVALWGERVSLQWVGGTVLMAVGLAAMTYAAPPPTAGVGAGVDVGGGHGVDAGGGQEKEKEL